VKSTPSKSTKSKSTSAAPKSRTTKATKAKTTKAGNLAVKPKRGTSGSTLPITPAPWSDLSTYSIMTGEKPYTVSAPKDLVKLGATGYVSIANNKNASTISNVPVKLYFNQSSSSIKSTAHKSVSSFDFNHIKKSFNSPIVKQMENSSDIVEIVEHPLLDLLSIINNAMNYVDFVSLEQLYLGLIGNAYCRIEFNKDNGLPSSLHPLVSEDVTPVADNGGLGKIVEYKYVTGNKKKIFKAKDIIHFINYSPAGCSKGNLMGVGELESVVDPQTRYNFYNAAESYFNKNLNRPDTVWVQKNKVSQKDLNEFYKQLYKRIGGSNMGKPIVTNGDIDLHVLSMPPKEMQWVQGRRSAVLEIINAFGIPGAMVKLNSSNLASAMVATSQYYRFTVFPKLAKFVAKLNETLVPKYAQPGLFLWYDSRVPVDAVSNSTMVLAQLDAGVISVEEARQELGYDPDPLQSAQEGSGRVKE